MTITLGIFYALIILNFVSVQKISRRLGEHYRNSHICRGAQNNFVNFWYTCDFHMEPDPDAMSEECRQIYSNKAGQSDVYELYKAEADLFYKFRNKLVECESHGKICALSDNNNAIPIPLLSGYDIDNRVRMYQNSDMNQCYLESTDNIEFIKCIIEKRQNMINELNGVCANI